MARTLSALLTIFFIATYSIAQENSAHPQRVIGVITEAQPGAFKVKTDAAEIFTISFTPETRFQRVAPGVTDLSKASVITAADVAAGDRVLARGSLSGDRALAAQSVVVISSSDLAAKQARETAAWQNGVAGLVTAVNPAAKEIVVRVPSLIGEAQTVAVVAGDRTIVRRYAPDSVRFADAKPGTIAEIRAGDQLRARGERTADGSRITAEEIVTGAFRTVAATVVSASGNTVQVKEVETGKPLTVRLTADSNLRRFPEMPFGVMGGAGGAGAPGGAGRPGAPPAGMGPGSGDHPMGPGAGMRRGAPSLAQMVERMPRTTAADLKPGETVIVASTRGANENELTAITLLAGAERFIAMRQQMAARQSGGREQGNANGPAGNWNLEVSMPMQ